MPKDTFDILVSDPLDESATARLKSIGRVRVLSKTNEATLIDEVAGADALVVRSYAKVTAAVIEAGTSLKVIGRGGVGLEEIDLAAARKHSIQVVYTPAAASDSVAEFAIGLIINLERHIAKGQSMLREGRFKEARRTLVGRELRSLTLGIIGMGKIGRRVGRIAQTGLGMRVLFNDLLPIEGLDFEATPAEKPRIWAEADIVSLHVPLTELTHHLVDASVLATLRPHAKIINTSRGPVVDSHALAAALTEGKLGGAALDVHDPEPPPANHPLLSAPNLLLSPHIAARTDAGLARMNDVVDDVIAVLNGQVPRFAAPS